MNRLLPVVAVALCLLWAPGLAAAQQPEAKAVAWATDLDAALATAKATQKLILVDVYTDWCAYCVLMDQRVYQKQPFVDYINQKFVAVRLNAETTDTLSYQGKRFPYHSNQRVNELAYLLLDGRLEYPATVFLTPQGEIIQAVHGYIEPQTMDRVLHYFGDGNYRTNRWDIYMNRY